MTQILECPAEQPPVAVAPEPASAAWLRVRPTPLALRLVVSSVAMAVILSVSTEFLPHRGVVAMAVVFIASTLSSIAGFAFSALCGALLFHLMPPVRAVQLLMVCSIAIQAYSVVALRHLIDWRALSRFLIGGLFSIPLGVYLLLTLDAGLYCRVLGGFLIAYGLFMLLRPATRLEIQCNWADGIVGMLGGITGGFAALPAPFVTIWCTLKGWDKRRQRGVYQPFILIIQVFGLAVLSLAAAGSHRTSRIVGIDAASYVPAALLGTWCGLGCYYRLSDAQFRIIVNLLLIVSGAALAI